MESNDRRILATHLAILFEMIREICKSFRSVKKGKNHHNFIQTMNIVCEYKHYTRYTSSQKYFSIIFII